MNKLIYDASSHGQKVIFSTSEELDSWLENQSIGTLFAVDKLEEDVIYTVIKIRGENDWKLSSLRKTLDIKFFELVNEFDLYYIDDYQMIGLIEICEN